MLIAAMTLMDAKQFDEKRARQRRTWIISGILLALVLLWLGYHFRNYPERRIVSNFFAALQKQDYESAYGIWFRDADWKQHPTKYPSYAYNEFYRDWGPGGEWGLVKTYEVDCSVSPESAASGVIVQVTVNGRAQHAYVWVQKSDKTMSFSPSEVQCGNWFGWLTE